MPVSKGHAVNIPLVYSCILHYRMFDYCMSFYLGISVETGNIHRTITGISRPFHLEVKQFPLLVPEGHSLFGEVTHLKKSNISKHVT